MRHAAICALYDYFWQKADRHPVKVRDTFNVTARIEYKMTLLNNASNKIIRHMD